MEKYLRWRTPDKFNTFTNHSYLDLILNSQKIILSDTKKKFNLTLTTFSSMCSSSPGLLNKADLLNSGGAIGGGRHKFIVGGELQSESEEDSWKEG